MSSKNVPMVALLRSFPSGSRPNPRQSSGRNIKLEIEYDGTDYAGWQVQKRRLSSVTCRAEKTLQGTIEKALHKILQEKVRLIASGRTDAGVHALAQVTNFHTHSLMPLGRLKLALNSLLPHDICIRKIRNADLKFHSRFDAKSKIYRYTILNRKYHSAFLRDRCYFFPHHLDLKLMKSQASKLIGRHDFSAFRASGSKKNDPVRQIKRIRIDKQNDLIYIDIEADGFLYNMARIIVGTLIEIGRGRLTQDSIEELLSAKNRCLAGATAPAKGLCLLRVRY